MSSSSVTVLVIDDDSGVREAVVEALEDSGRNVLAAENGAVGLLKLASIPPPCLIVLDLMMPEMDGFQFLDRLKARVDARAFPVLVISASDSLEKAELYSGVLGTLRKPFSSRDLLGWVDRYCPA